MKSRKVKAATRSKAFMKKLKSTIPLDNNDYGKSYTVDEDRESDDDEEKYQQENESSNEEEVLPITDDESDDSEKDVEEAEDNSEEDDLPDVNNWGKRKGIYYNADFVDKDRGKTYREEDLELENAEREAAYLQQQAAIDMDKFESAAYYEDYDRAIELISKKPLKTQEAEDNDEPEIEKLKHEKRKYPKFIEYKEKFEEKLAELNDKYAPLVELLEKVELEKNISLFIKLKYQILLQYLLNLNFYLYLKNVETIPENHPIYERIEQFKELDDRMNSRQNCMKEVDNILKQLQQSKEIPSLSKSQEILSKTQNICSLPQLNCNEKTEDKKLSKKKKKTFKQVETAEEKEIFALYKGTKESNQQEKDDEDNDMEIDNNPITYVDENTGEKRTITYKIAKNKGLVPKRKKEYRNPRVHHRMKFRKAKIRRKGQVREVVKEIKRYGGEHTGISAHVVRSVKLK